MKPNPAKNECDAYKFTKPNPTQTGQVHKRHKIKAVLDDMRGRSQIFCLFGTKQPTAGEGEPKQPPMARRVNNYAIAVKEDQKCVFLCACDS